MFLIDSKTVRTGTLITHNRQRYTVKEIKVSFYGDIDVDLILTGADGIGYEMSANRLLRALEDGSATIETDT
jgi:hypothetical protein